MSKKIFATVVLFALVTGITGFYIGQLSGKSSASVNESLSGNADQHTAATSDHTHSTNATYVCPMHAEIVAGEPQSCPICGMDLVKKKTSSSVGTLPEGEYPMVKISPAVAHNLAVRTAIVKRGELKRNIETIGKITRVDPMARRTITPPIRGELLYIAEKHQGDMVENGELLFTMTSDELTEMQNAYQSAFQSGDRATAMSMVPELRERGMSPEQIGQLQTGADPMPVEVYAFEDGFVFTRRGKIGELVHTGFTVFNVGGNYQVIEVTAEIFERQWSWVEEGQLATMTVRGLPGVSFEGQVVRVEPPVGYTTRSLEIALKFRTDNDELSQSMFAHISIDGRAKKNVLLVPTDTVIKTGKGDRVVKYVGENEFQPVEVIAGAESGGFTEIRKGLKENDKVVASGQFLIDSESNLQAELNRMVAPLSESAAQHSASSGSHMTFVSDSESQKE